MGANKAADCPSNYSLVHPSADHLITVLMRVQHRFMALPISIDCDEFCMMNFHIVKAFMSMQLICLCKLMGSSIQGRP